VVWALTERTGAGAETAGEELLEQLGPATALALAGIAGTMLATRWITRRATARIDQLVADAAQISADDLSVRLAVSGDGDELDELSGALNQMFARLDRGLSAQRQFAADASHELRTPLTAALAALEVARRRPRSDLEWAVTADGAIVELTRMSTVIDALLQLAHAEVELGPRDEVVLADVAEQVRAAFATRTDVRIAADLDGTLSVDGDAAALEIALGNLVANAVAHAPPGTAVTITAARVDASVRLDVIDRGPGVAPAERARIFEPFTRGAAARADRVAHGAGVGLGLPIARRIALAHGGQVAVDEPPGGGARFSLWLPARR